MRTLPAELTVDGLKDAVEVARSFKPETERFNASVKQLATDVHALKQAIPSTTVAGGIGFALGVVAAVLFQWRGKR